MKSARIDIQTMFCYLFENERITSF